MAVAQSVATSNQLAIANRFYVFKLKGGSNDSSGPR